MTRRQESFAGAAAAVCLAGTPPAPQTTKIKIADSFPGPLPPKYITTPIWSG